MTDQHQESGEGVGFYEDDWCRLVFVGGESGMVVCLPEDEVRAVVVFVHGIAEHSARHYGTAKRLAREGVATVLFDLDGHGFEGLDEEESIDPVRLAYATHDDAGVLAQVLSEQSKGNEEGYRKNRKLLYSRLRRVREADHYQRVIDACEYARTRFGDSMPLFLVGFSLGGLLSVGSAPAMFREDAGKDMDINGVILINPALGPRGRADSWQENLVRWLWRRRDRLSLTHSLFKGLMKIPLSLNCAWVKPWLTDLEDEFAVQDGDPLIHDRLPLRYVSGWEFPMMCVHCEAGDVIMPPTLLFISEEDRIVDPDEAIHYANETEAGGFNPIEKVVFKGFFPHDILHSSRRDEVLEGIVSWMMGAGN